MLLLVSIPLRSAGTLDDETWCQMTLIGESREHYFRWLAERAYKGGTGAYYQYTETLRFQKVGKSENDRAVAEDVLVREVTVAWDPDPETIGTVTEKPLPAFDLIARLRQEQVTMAFPVYDAPALVLDAAGLSIEVNGERERVLDRVELARRIWPLEDDLRAAGAELALGGTYYYRVSGSFRTCDLLLLSEVEIQAARDRLYERQSGSSENRNVTPANR